MSKVVLPVRRRPSAETNVLLLIHSSSEGQLSTPAVQGLPILSGRAFCST